MPDEIRPKMEVYDGDTVQLGQVSDIGGFNTIGEYVARMSRLDPTTSRKGDPMLNVFFEILEGSFEGEEVRKSFWLGARKDAKSGRIFAPGVAEIRAACASIGQPLGDVGFKLDAIHAGRVFGNAFLNKRIRLRVMPDTKRTDDDGNKVEGATQIKIMGLAGGHPATAQAQLQAHGGVQSGVDPLSGIV